MNSVIAYTFRLFHYIHDKRILRHINRLISQEDETVFQRISHSVSNLCTQLFSIRARSMFCVIKFLFRSCSNFLTLKCHFIPETKGHSCNHFYHIVDCSRIIPLFTIGGKNTHSDSLATFSVPEENECFLLGLSPWTSRRA